MIKYVSNSSYKSTPIYGRNNHKELQTQNLIILVWRRGREWVCLQEIILVEFFNLSGEEAPIFEYIKKIVSFLAPYTGKPLAVVRKEFIRTVLLAILFFRCFQLFRVVSVNFLFLVFPSFSIDLAKIPVRIF